MLSFFPSLSLFHSLSYTNLLAIPFGPSVNISKYDTFMTFITPLFTPGGQSVMVAVALAGAGAKGGCDPDTGVRSFAEKMPILFMLPRLGWMGGYAMLGIGDIVIPGILLTFAQRVDLLRHGRVLPCASSSHNGPKPCCGYGPLVCFAYSVGLFLAMLANMLGWTINNVKGQPALLWICPCLLGMMCLVACVRGELRSLWRGSIKKDVWIVPNHADQFDSITGHDGARSSINGGDTGGELLLQAD